LLRKYLLACVCIATLVLSGCGEQYDPHWQTYRATLPGQWQVNNVQYVTDSDTEFSWTIYVGTMTMATDYTNWTTNTTWKQISSKEAMLQLGDMWKLVPQGHFYFYVLSIPDVAWYPPAGSEMMVGVSTSAQNNSDNSRLVQGVIYRNVTDAPILLATKPLQLTSITTNQDKQSITFTWKPLPSLQTPRQ
jgi:hypothetical protein